MGTTTDGTPSLAGGQIGCAAGVAKRGQAANGERQAPPTSFEASGKDLCVAGRPLSPAVRLMVSGAGYGLPQLLRMMYEIYKKQIGPLVGLRISEAPRWMMPPW